MEKIWKEVVVAELRYYLGIKLEGLKEAIGNFGQDTRCSAEIRNRYFPNISRALQLPHLVRYQQIGVWLGSLGQIRNIRCAEHVTRMRETRNSFRILAGRS
jgi:hypothetical protein